MSSENSSSPPTTVSVVIPTYNRVASLATAIESVLAQTLSAIELIVVDDGSSDGTSDWIRTTYPTIRLITQNNHGVSHARNRGIEHSTGSWIALLDSDDRWYPDKLATQVRAIENNPGYRLCHCDEHWLRNGKRVNPKFKHRKFGGDVFRHCLPLCAISPSATLLKRSLLDDVGLFDESLPACEDYDMWLRISAREAVLYVEEPLLEKTGGHDDQLSQRHAAMDQFRLRALAKLIRSNSLNEAQLELALSTFHSKLTIYCNGARKRYRLEAVNEVHQMYADMIDKHVNQ